MTVAAWCLQETRLAAFAACSCRRRLRQGNEIEVAYHASNSHVRRVGVHLSSLERREMVRQIQAWALVRAMKRRCFWDAKDGSVRMSNVAASSIRHCHHVVLASVCISSNTSDFSIPNHTGTQYDVARTIRKLNNLPAVLRSQSLDTSNLKHDA